MSARENILIAFVAAAVVAIPQSAAAQQTCTPRPVALFESVQNSVQLVQASTRAPIRAVRQVPVCAGDTIQVGDNSRAVILMLASNTPLVIDQNSEFIVTETPTNNCRRAGPTSAGAFVDLVRGALLFITRVRRSVEICTPFVNAAIEGTEFVVRVQADRTLITVFEGSVRATNAMGMVVVGPGQQAVAVQDQAPQIQVIARPRDAVQWALYYEPVLPVSSLEQLAAVPEASRDAAFYVRRAGLVLAAGQLDEARVDLDQAQKLDPSSGDAYALRAIVAVALNDKDGALSNGRMAVDRAPQSASAHLALSYALQANLQLEAARDAAARATELEPANGGALARLAETRLMLDDLGGAVRAARAAVQRSPQAARPQVVLGFTLLAQLRPSQARAAFERAINLEPDSPLARLGMGLTRIRQGRLAEGRADLELAMALSPDNSLIRSYVGKAYFEEKREPLPAEQFEQAKQLDPQDPTPWFYDAIRKQTLNRPVEALRDLQTSIDLNDHRAVYRSRLRLDQDLAVRSASLGRLHSDLGFEQLALVEGWKSLNANAGDFSGHRLLADTYSAIPRHEIARVSELLQAQLLQPLSLTPIPARLSQTDLFILELAGPSQPAFSEFNPLFNRNRLAAQVGGVIGQHSTGGDEVTVSGVWNRLSFSLGQFHYDTNGSRPNNGQDRDLFNAFIQTQLTHATMLQAEFRFEETLTGDLITRFDPSDFDAVLRRTVRTRTGRVGARHVFSPSSQIIASVYGQERHLTLSERVEGFGPTPPTDVITLAQFDGGTAEVQHLLQSRYFRVTSGAGRFDGDRETTLTTRFGPPINRTRTIQTVDSPEHSNAYAYATVDAGKSLALTLGASADFFKTGAFERNQVNPKFGATWSPVASTTVRLAAFRTLRRPIISNQTIEPTQIAGFNQSFADLETDGLEARNYGIAIDQKVRRSMSGGASYMWRNLQVPVGARVDEAEEQVGTSYLYWTPTDGTSVRFVYQFERFDRPVGLAAAFRKLRTHRVPMGLRFFTPSGLIATIEATYVDQHGVFVRGTTYAGEDRFWTVDTSFGYRLPRRYGRLILEVRNLFDEQFRFQDTDPGNPTIRAGRLVVAKFALGV